MGQDGNVYIGEHIKELKGLRTGFGKMIYKNGDQYDGQWLNNDQWVGKIKYSGKRFWSKSAYGNFYKKAAKKAKKERDEKKWEKEALEE